MQSQVEYAASTFQAQANNLLAESRESFRQILAQQVIATERRVDNLHESVARARREQDRQADEQKKMWQQIEQMRDTLALAEAQAPITDLTKLADWDRTPDPTIFSIG